MRPRSTVGKRLRERDKVERQREKMEKRKLRKQDREARAANADGDEDPDIAGIEPGPQELDPELFGIS